MYFSSSSNSFLHPASTVNNSMEISKNHCFIPLFCKYHTASGHIKANLHHHTPVESTWIKEMWELNSALVLSETFHICRLIKSQNLAGRYCETLLPSHAWGNLCFWEIKPWTQGHLVRWCWQGLEFKSSSFKAHALSILWCLWQRTGWQSKPSSLCQMKMACPALASEKIQESSVKSPGLRNMWALPKISFSDLSRDVFGVQYFLDPTWFFSKKALMPWIHFSFQVPCPLEPTFYLLQILYAGVGDTSRFFQVN